MIKIVEQKIKYIFRKIFEFSKMGRKEKLENHFANSINHSLKLF